MQIDVEELWNTMHIFWITQDRKSKWGMSKKGDERQGRVSWARQGKGCVCKVRQESKELGKAMKVIGGAVRGRPGKKE